MSGSMDLERNMKFAIEEAEESLREGNHGFGAVIIKNNEVVARAHDTEETEGVATAHAEIIAIRRASRFLGKNLGGCVILSTHEPCPMCAAAIVWANIGYIVYGYSIEETIEQGRNRIRLSCEELFDRANAAVRVEKHILRNECAVLYNQEVRAEIKKLRNATDAELRSYDRQRAEKRIEWYRSQNRGMPSADSALLKAYRVLLARFRTTEAECPVVERDERKLVFRSANFCPTLEACKILQVDTKRICRLSNEGSADRLVREVHPKLRFSRNYKKIRPYSEYCEEFIEYAD